MLKIPSHLSDALEDLIHRTIGCCITVHRALGPGLLEGIYCRAICLELAAANISFEAQKRYPVSYRGQLLSYQRLDLIVEEQLVLEIKSVEQLNQLHRSQVLSQTTKRQDREHPSFCEFCQRRTLGRVE